MRVVAGFTLLHSLIQALVDFGLNTSIAKFVSESIGRKADYAKHFFSALAFRLITSIAILLLLLASIASLLNGVLLGSGRFVFRG